jgi:uncharacterized membrane protein YphA (DoxX/SURF4 family)
MTAVSSWRTPPLHDARRGVDLVRLCLAVVLVSHPAHAVLHPADARALADALAQHGVPGALAVAWLALAGQLLCALALTTRRLAAPAAIGSMIVLAGGASFATAHHWFVVGGAAIDGEPGIEFHVLLIHCLAGVAWASWPHRDPDRARTAHERGMQILRVVSALSLVPHGAYAFVTWDVEGMRGWGEAMAALGWPCGVALVWTIKGVELTSALARISGRFVVPACLGNLAVLLPGMWIAHRLHWFVVGPGEGGIEFSVVLVAGAVASILAYAPVRRRARSTLR